jgi:hypothetical protein
MLDDALADAGSLVLGLVASVQEGPAMVDNMAMDDGGIGGAVPDARLGNGNAIQARMVGRLCRSTAWAFVFLGQSAEKPVQFSPVA